MGIRQLRVFRLSLLYLVFIGLRNSSTTPNPAYPHRFTRWKQSRVLNYLIGLEDLYC